MSNKKSRRYTEQADALRKKLGNRDYILGLDLGVGSIGSAVVAIDRDGTKTYPSDIVYSGARIFPSSRGAADRREHRSQRNSLRHRKNRLKWVWKTLAAKGLMLPFSTEDVPDPATLRFSEETRRHDPYALRYEGLTERLELQDLGYALYHIANHRGSSSVMADDDSKKKSASSKYGPSKDLTKSLFKEGIPFITILHDYNDGEEYKVYRNTDANPDAIAPMPTRDLIENELNKLLETQKKHHPDVLTDEYIAEIKKAILFENEMLVPEAGNCPYFPDEKKLPKSSFINEERRLWEALNNVRFTIQSQQRDGTIVYKRNCQLDDENRIKCFGILEDGNDLTPSVIRKLLSPAVIDDIKLQGTVKKDQRIKGFRFTGLRNNPFFKSLDEDTANDILYLWTNAVSTSRFVADVVSKYGFEKSRIEGIIELLPNTGTGQYAPCGISAMRIILQYIIEARLSFNEAICAAIEAGKLSDSTIIRDLDSLPYYGKALPASMQRLMGKAWHSAFADKVGKKGFNSPNTDSDEEKNGRIANPVVHQTMNELRGLVNEMIELFGKKPAEIRIEVARELKIGQEKRDQISKDNNDRRRQNERIYETYCVKHNLPPRYIKTFRIWEEQGKVCPYCVENDTISVEDIILGKADLDHIFPREDIPGNPENNLIVSHKECNELVKSKRIPYEYYSNRPEWNRILSKLESNEGMKSRMWRFTMTGEEYEKWLKSNGMLSRFKSDNAYISVISRDYLNTLYSEEQVRHGVVSTIRGSETAMLRHAWGVQDITSDLAALHDPSVLDNPTTDKVRIDVRHHALDAIVIAYSSRNAITRINTRSAQGMEYDMIKDSLSVPYRFSKTNPKALKENQALFRFYLKEELFNNTFISRKIDHSPTGELLKGTSYAFIASEGNDLIYWTKKKVADIDDLDKALTSYRLPKWIDNDIPGKQKIEAFINHNARIHNLVLQNMEKAEALIIEENNEAQAKGKKLKAVTEKSILKRALMLTGGRYYSIGNGSLSKMFATRQSSQGKPGNIYDSSENYCIDLYHDEKGLLHGEVIRKIDILNKDFVPDYEKKGYSLFFRLFTYDALEVDCTEKMVKTPNSSSKGRTVVVPVTFTARPNGSIQLFFDSYIKERPEKNSSFMIPSTIKSCNARILSLSRLGLVKYVSPIIGDKENCGE
jgi:CRISPR-associated endonuclease Csn1